MRAYLRKRIFIFALLIMVGIFSVSTLTYAIFTATTIQTGTNSITTLDCLTMEFSERENVINMVNTFPMSDAKAMEKLPYKFTLKNTCPVNMKTEINLESLSVANAINHNYIKVYFDYVDIEPQIKILNTLTTKTATITGATSKSLGSITIYAYEEKEFELKLWIKEDVTAENIGTNKNYQGKITLNIMPDPSGDIYGVRRNVDTSSSAWERVYASEGLIANAQIGETPVQNDFDNIYPWSDIISYNYNTSTKEETMYGDAAFKFDGTNGEVLTRIPEFYYKRYQGTDTKTNITYEYVLISEEAKSGFSKSDTFSVGRYTMSGDATAVHSKSGVQPLVSTTITDFRNYARNLGEDFGQLDYRVFILQLLYLVEYANYNSQSVLAQGYVNGNTDNATSGGCDSLGMKSGTPNNDGKNSMIYRGIEDIYGNVWQFVDGINIKNFITYVCYTPSEYKINEYAGCYKPVGYTNLNADVDFPSKVGYDANNPLIAVAIASGGSSNTYITDGYNSSTSNSILEFGGAKATTQYAGFFRLIMNIIPSSSSNYLSSRLLRYN